MDNVQKSVRHENQEDMNSIPKRDKINHRSDVNLQYWPETHNRSVEHRTLQLRKPSDQVNSMHADDPTPKNIFNKILRSSK